MKIAKPRGYVCVGCGRDISERDCYDVGALSPLLKGCAVCIMKYGTEALRIEGDRLLALFEQKRAERTIPREKLGKCWHCGEHVLRNLVTGEYPAWCDLCEQQRLEIVRRNAPLEVTSHETPAPDSVPALPGSAASGG